MGDASGTYASPTGSDLQNGGAGQRQGSDDSHENVSLQRLAGMLRIMGGSVLFSLEMSKMLLDPNG